MKARYRALKAVLFFTIIMAGIIFLSSSSFTQEISLPDDLGFTQNETMPATEIPLEMTSNQELNEPAPAEFELPAMEETMPQTEGIEKEEVFEPVPVPEVLPLIETPAVPADEPKKEETAPAGAEIMSPSSTNVTLDFKDADIRNVLRILSYKSGVNIVASPEVSGMVTIRLMDVPWQTALDVILKTYGFGYEKHENIIAVSPLDKLTAQKKAEADLAQVQPTETRVFNLRFIDAGDMKKAIESQLSPRGKITVLEMTGPAGWEFGTSEFGKRKRLTEERRSRSKILIISDVPPALDKIAKVIKAIDIMPQQVLIESRILEVQKDVLKDFGLDFGTGTTGAESAAVQMVNVRRSMDISRETAGLHSLGSELAPSAFGPKASAIGGVEPFNMGLELVYKKLTGIQFEVILHALEEDARTNTLSAPRILTLNNQEASILVGTKYPILESSTSEYGTVTTTLGYYQDIGIQLNVVPQINADGYINMIVHPAVTSTTQQIGTNLYPIIESRETEVQILVKDGETVVIGGLLKDVKTTSKFSIPLLGDIPILGKLFQRNTIDTGKVDLLVFITAHIIQSEAEDPLVKVEEKIIPQPTQKPMITKVPAPALTPPKTEEPKK
ncbi:MAG: type IV pilus secretin PilQ [Candidatus Omnitrophota bacterium]